MKLHTIEYRSGYRRQCIDLMGDTWNFNALFPGIRRENLANELFFREAIVNANYSELVVDDHGNVQGYLFGIIRHAPKRWIASIFTMLQTILWAFLHFLAGNFGPHRLALLRFGELLDMTGLLDGLRKPDDAYVCLFFVRSSLRGLGWGKRLMDSFHVKASHYGCGRIYLWTDKGCNFRFYDSTGFKRIREISSPLLAEPGPDPNGFVYAREIDRSPAADRLKTARAECIHKPTGAVKIDNARVGA